MCIHFRKHGAPGEIQNTTGPGECSVFSKGYMGTVVPVSGQQEDAASLLNWRLVVVLGGILVMGMVSFIGGLVWKTLRRRRTKELEMQTEMGVAVGTVWVGRSRLPAANMCRTQPQLESEMLP
uniref:Uncharacterized protein n=1 Tax=Kalanchoe fedtschenkoi TaxID=63787 RepID=A0A7N0V1I3_KALFE